MSTYLVTYDLRQPEKNYSRLFNVLEKYDHERVLKSVWLVSSNESAEQIRNHLAQYIDGNDQLLVIAAGIWAGQNLSTLTNAWLCCHRILLDVD